MTGTESGTNRMMQQLNSEESGRRCVRESKKDCVYVGLCVY